MGKDTNKNREMMIPKQKDRIQARLEKKCAELNKRYPDNNYTVDRNYIIRKSGRRPHKVSKKSASFIKKVAEVLVGMADREKKG